MKTTHTNPLWRIALVALLTGVAQNALGQDIIVNPARGGGLDTNAPMIHVDISYDAATRQLQAILDTSKGIPKLTPLPTGYAFDANSKYAVLSGKAYNFQLAWNPGNVFAPPPGAAIWIECLNASPGLEVYDGPGNKTENPPRPYTPIFGTAGSSSRWSWYGRMAHNTYAILNPTTSSVTAEYRVYFGDAETGAPEAYAGYGDATVTLTWAVDPVLIVNPARGGGLDTNAPMIHVDISYDAATRQLQAILDTSKGIPKLTPLPTGYAFDAKSKYAVLSGKAYNFQLAWNPGNVFAPPPGAAVWIECLSASPGLEVYDGPGNKTEDPPRPYTPIFGTAGSSSRWSWYGRMAHNTYAIRSPASSTVTAEYRVYFGDAETGAAEAYTDYADARVTLTWTVDPSAFRPGPRIECLTRRGTEATASFSCDLGRTFYLERTRALGPSASWETVAGPLTGMIGPQTLTDLNAADSQGFYRLRATTP